MSVFEIPATYGKESVRFFRSPRAFTRGVDFDSPEEAKTSVKYLGFAFLLTSAFVLVELKLIPDELTGRVSISLKKDELIFFYWVSILVFALLTHAACRLLAGQGRLRASLAGLFRTYCFLIPATTLAMIVLSQLVAVVLGTYWLVTPPLRVRGFEPFEPTTGHLLLVAGFMTAYFYLALLFLLCTVWALHEIHRLSYVRTLIAVGVSVGLLSLSQPLIVQGARKVFDLFEPLIKLFE
jgi:hypothetical protein